MYIFVKVCLGSSYSIAVPDCNDTSSLEACNCIIRANSPVFTTFYFRFRHWAFWTKLIATIRLKTFQYRLVWTCIHKKLIACHSLNFKICVGSRIILPVTLLQPTKTDDRKRSNWPPDFPLTSAEVNLKVYCPWLLFTAVRAENKTQPNNKCLLG